MLALSLVNPSSALNKVAKLMPRCINRNSLSTIKADRFKIGVDDNAVRIAADAYNVAQDVRAINTRLLIKRDDLRSLGQIAAVGSVKPLNGFSFNRVIAAFHDDNRVVRAFGNDLYEVVRSNGFVNYICTFLFSHVNARPSKCSSFVLISRFLFLKIRTVNIDPLILNRASQQFGSSQTSGQSAYTVRSKLKDIFNKVLMSCSCEVAQ